MRRGFTLIELLVSILIIGVLTAMLIPAVQSMRESARLVNCKNKQKQIGLAAANYESAHQAYPPGQLVAPNSVRESQLIGHLIFLLPYIEQQPLHDRLKAASPHEWRQNVQGEPWYKVSQLSTSVLSANISSLRCPSDGFGGAKNWLFCSKYFQGGGEPFLAKKFDSPQQFWTNYLGSCGSIVTKNQTGNIVFKPNDGIFYENSSVKLSEIQDGLSNTFMIGEVVGGLAFAPLSKTEKVNSRHSAFQNGIGGLFGYFGDAVVAEDYLNRNLRSMFSSSHYGGKMIIFTRSDGSVDAYSRDTELIVLNSLMTRSGGEVSDE